MHFGQCELVFCLSFCGTGPFDPSVVAIAQAFENSCNAVLRSVAQSVLKNVDAK